MFLIAALVGIVSFLVVWNFFRDGDDGGGDGIDDDIGGGDCNGCGGGDDDGGDCGDGGDGGGE